MIWDSVALMSLIDLVIFTITGAAIWVVVRARADLAAARALPAAKIVILGLGIVAAFHVVDLFVMHVLPTITSPVDAMATMDALHRNLSWVTSLAAVVAIFVGFVGIVRSEVVLASRLRSTHDELRDTTAERASIEATLATVEDRLARALRAARMGTWVYDPRARRLEWSEEVAEIMGLEPGAGTNSFEGALGFVHPDDRDAVGRALSEALAAGGSYAIEHRTITPAGETLWVATQGWAYSEDDGPATLMTGVVWDITEQRRALEAKEEAEREQAELNRRLSRQQRLESLGTLSGGIAHDFNNLLTPILGNIELLKQDARSEDDSERLEQIRIAAERAKGLVRQILSFSGNVEPAGVAVDVGQVVGEAVDLVRATLPSTIEIRRELDEDAGAVAADPTQLTQVLVNLCTNASHSMPEGGVIDVRVRRVELDGASPGVDGALPAGEYVEIAVTDTGTGMSEPIAERAFEPFFTTKDIGEGTGLGLSQVLGIVKTYGGSVRIDSERGRGTTVVALLPVVDAPVTHEPPAPATSSVTTGRVLVVDDEPAVADLLGTMLGNLGYEVTIAATPHAALKRLDSSGEAFDLLVTDQTMPGMTGTMLAQAVRDLRPGFPTILTSGFTDPDHARESDVVFLMKPFTRAQLTEAVEAALGGRGR